MSAAVGHGIPGPSGVRGTPLPPGETGIRIWGERSVQANARMWKEFNVRVLVHRLLDSRQTPPWMKLSRRSRRRWRGRGGEWVYSGAISDMLKEAIDDLERLAAA